MDASTEQADQVWWNLLKVFQQEIHQSEMAQVGRGRTAIMQSSAEPALYRRRRSITDSSNDFMINVPLGIELLWSHPQLAATVEVD